MLENFKLRLPNPLIAILFAIASYLVLIQADENIFLSDTEWATHVYASIMYEGNTDLDEFREVIEARDYQSARVKGEKIYSYFPLGTPIFVTPILFVLERYVVEFDAPNLNEYLKTSLAHDPVNLKIHHFSASFVIAAVSIFFYLSAVYYVPRGYALLISIVFIFGTTAYSTASRSLWQHGPSMLMLAITLWLIIRAENDQSGLSWAGLILACAYVIRPSNSVPVAVLTAYIFFYHRKYFIGFISSSLPIAILFFYNNLIVYEKWLHPYFAASRLRFVSTFPEALLGHLVSPARGLFIFSPFLVILLVILVRGIKQNKLKIFDWVLIAITVLHWIAVSMFPHWWGGFSYGPRLFTDMIPIFFVLFIRNFSILDPYFNGERLKSTVAHGAFAGLSILSIGIHHLGVVNQAGLSWNNTPSSVDQFPERLWDWGDVQILRPFIRPDRIGVTVAKVETVDNLTTFDLQLSNMDGDPKFWEFHLFENVRLLPEEVFVYDADDAGNLIARYKFPINEYSIHPVQIVFDHNELAVSNYAAKVVVFTAENLQIGEAVLPLDETVSVGTFTDIGRANNLKIFFGHGWYPQEFAGDFAYRWSRSPAKIFIYSSKKQSANLELVLGEMFDSSAENGKGDSGTLRLISVSGQTVEIPVQNGIQASTQIELDAGYNQFDIELGAGNFSPNSLNQGDSDLRELSFILNRIELN